MPIYLGNLTIKEMESRMGITLTDAERETLEHMRCDSANTIPAGQFHIFDIPQCVVCGSMDAAMKCKEILTPYVSQIKGRWDFCLAEGGSET